MSVSISGAGSISGLDQGFNVTTGSIGIGTVSPASILHTSGSSDQTVTIQTTTAGADSRINFRNSGGTDAGGIHYKHNGNHLTFLTGGSLEERLRITSDGKLLIGSDTSSVHGNRLLQVGKTDRSETYVSIVSNTSGESGLLFADTTTNDTGGYRGQIRYHHSDDSMNFRTAATERVRITSAGLVGINCTPFAQFHVKTGTNANISMSTMSSEASIEAYNDAGSANVPLRIRGTDIKFFSSSTERLRIRSDGDVIIGTDDLESQLGSRRRLAVCDTTNGALVHIRGQSPAVFFDVSSGGIGKVFLDGASFAIQSGTPGTEGNERLRITSDGHVLHGVTADEDTSGNGGLRFINSGDIQIDGDQRALVFRSTNNTAQLQSAIEWWNENGAGVQSKIACDRTAVSQAPSDLVFYTSPNVDSGGTSSDGDITERLRITSGGKLCVNTTLSNYGVVHIRDASGDSTTSAIQVENASSGSNTTNVISRSVSLNSGAWANAEYRAKSHIFSYQTTQVATIQQHGLTIASQPCFWATSNTGGSHTNNGATGIISNQLEAAYVNVGNHFNTSTGVFTCPVAGTYEFHGQGLARYQGGDGNCELTFYKNGSNTMSRSYGYTYVKGSSDHDNLHVMGYITCAANDQIDLRVHALSAGVDCYFAQGLGYFAGRLVQ